MHIESYVVEVQSLTTEEWNEDQRFTPKYRWGARQMRGLLNLFGFFRRTRPAIETPTTILSITAKADALQRARKALRERKPRSVRIMRVWREGARIYRIAVWHNGTWLE